MAETRPPRTGGGRKVAAIAWREFRHTVLTKGFIIGAVAVPVIMVVAIGAGFLMMQDKVRPTEGTVAVLDATGTVAPFVTEELSVDRVVERAEAANRRLAAAGAPGVGTFPTPVEPAAEVNVRVDAVTDPAREADLRQGVSDGSLLGLVLVPPELLARNPAGQADGAANYALIVPSNSPPRTTDLLQSAVSTAIVRARVAAAGEDYADLRALMSRPGSQTRTLSADGVENKENMVAKMMVPMGFMMLLWIATFTSGNYLLTSTIEEKSSKVMEVLLSAVSPMQLLLGKMLGYSMVSAIMLVSYGGLTMFGLAALSMQNLVSPLQLVYMVIFFVMAYMFVATIMVSVGSAVSDLREAQSLIGPVMIVLVIPLILWMPISDNPNGWVATIFSFIPPAIPYVMILRVTASSDAVPVWQVLLSVVWGFACVFGFLWAGAKIFRVGVLMQGKPPTPRELLRWIRMA